MTIINDMRYECDACTVSRATMVAAKPGKQYLFFCDHHMRQHQVELVCQGWILDEL